MPVKKTGSMSDIRVSCGSSKRLNDGFVRISDGYVDFDNGWFWLRSLMDRRFNTAVMMA